MLWALMESLRRNRLQVQSFHSQACFPPYERATWFTGSAPRHLDSWLMSPAMCRDVFVRNAHAVDLSLIEGKFRTALPEKAEGGCLETLCQWLDLPRLVVLDARDLGRCRLPELPRRAKGLLIDGAASERQLAQLTTELEILWRIPVLGALVRSPPLDAQLDAVQQGACCSHELCRELGTRFLQHGHLEEIWQVANERELRDVNLQQVCPEPMRSKLTLAVAYDEAFHSYFPDTLDWLELRGASVVDFSPLRDESLPANTDIVYLGCGHPERYATDLSDNHCMKAALRNHLRAGRRIYGEGGGLAYLCEQMETAEGSLQRMVGIVPAIARLNRSASAPEPRQLPITHSCWLGGPGEILRGYRSPFWRLEPLGLSSFASRQNDPSEFVGNFQVVGSLVHLDFAAQPEFLRRFFHPRSGHAEPASSSNVWC